jgi:hypothetical protein
VGGAWDTFNRPLFLEPGSIVRFFDLPLQGNANQVPWSDAAWPTSSGGLCARWTGELMPECNGPRLSEVEIKRMTESQLAELSPGEKYDIFMGRFDFPTLEAERERTRLPVTQSASSCHGFCLGWPAASVNFDEPQPVTLMGAAGVAVPFGSSDIKALLAYAQEVVFSPMIESHQQGCNPRLALTVGVEPPLMCSPLDAGSFYLILSNSIGRQGQSLIAEWEHEGGGKHVPIFSFSTRQLSQQAVSSVSLSGVNTKVVLETELKLLKKLEQPRWLPLMEQHATVTEIRTLSFVVELDGLGRIVGGHWLSQQHPRNVWRQERAGFVGYYKAIFDLYEKSRSGN